MKTNLSIAIIFLFALQLSAEKKPKLSISFEKRVAVFEAGEPISINCKFRNRTSDTLEFEHSFGLISWEIHKGWKRIPLPSGRAFESYHERIYPNENKKLLGEPTAFVRFDSGIYFIKGRMRDEKGNIYESNRITLIVKKGNRLASKAAKECYNGKTNTIKIRRSMAFLEKYKKSHLKDDIVIHLAKIFEKEKKYEETIEILTQFEQADFKTSVHQRNGVFSRIASNYKKLGKYDEAISYYKKSTYRYGPDMPYKTQIDYEILYLQRDIEKKKNHPYWISFEGGLNEFEMGEPIKINCEFRNLRTHPLYFSKPDFTYPKWEVYRNGTKILPYSIYCGPPRIYPIVKVELNEKKKFFGDPYPIFDGNLISGNYVINGILNDTLGNIYRSNILNFTVKHADKNMLKDFEKVKYSSSTENDIKSGLHFLKTYKTSHLKDKVILKTSNAFFNKGEYLRAIDLLKEFDNPIFLTSEHERVIAILRLGLSYFEIEEYEKALFYYKKLPIGVATPEIKKAQQKLNEKKN